MRIALFPPLDKRNTRDKAKGLRVASERRIVELGVRCLSTIETIARHLKRPLRKSISSQLAQDFIYSYVRAWVELYRMAKKAI